MSFVIQTAQVSCFDEIRCVKIFVFTKTKSIIRYYKYQNRLRISIMWPIIMQMLRSNAPYMTLPVAAVVGVIGYNLESLLSDRYTPYTKPVQDQRLERLTEEEVLNDPTNVQKLRYKENVLGRNVSPSLQNK